MWIRSQDKKKLKEIHDVTIYHDKQIWAGCSFIGEYSTKEKALKVLDEIQGKIECPYPSKVTPAFGTNCYCLSEKGQFYEMPADEDVKA